LSKKSSAIILLKKQNKTHISFWNLKTHTYTVNYDCFNIEGRKMT